MRDCTVPAATPAHDAVKQSVTRTCRLYCVYPVTVASSENCVAVAGTAPTQVATTVAMGGFTLVSTTEIGTGAALPTEMPRQSLGVVGSYFQAAARARSIICSARKVAVESWL